MRCLRRGHGVGRGSENRPQKSSLLGLHTIDHRSGYNIKDVTVKQTKTKQHQSVDKVCSGPAEVTLEDTGLSSHMDKQRGFLKGKAVELDPGLGPDTG